VRGHWDHLGVLNQHPQEVVDNICDYGHLNPIHGSFVERFENEFKGHNATQRQCGGHRTLVGPDGVSAILHTDTTYHGPGVLVSYLTGMFETVLLIMHTPIDDGTLKVWHSLIVKSPGQNAQVNSADLVAARQYQEASRLAFAQDFEVWTQKAPCLNGLFIPSDGPFMKARIWYKQFYNPRAMKREFLDQCEGLYVPRGATPYTDPKQAA
jgi:3-ketosteroid 9alpha-monooxygenase subunit A